MSYPEDCLQSVTDEWWIKNESKQLSRGRLIWCFVPHVDQIPFGFEPIGRTCATEHDHADMMVMPLKANQPLKKTDLPVAGLPLHENEVWAAYKAKKRPCLVLGGTDCPEVEKYLIRGKPKSATSNTFVAAPYFGCDHNSRRSGYNEAFIQKVRHCLYPQFFWDILPINSKSTNSSLLRFDQLRPIGRHHDSYELTEHQLSEDALEIIDDILGVILWGGLPEESIVLDFVEQIKTTFPEELETSSE